MSYGNLSSRFVPKEKVTEDAIREFLMKHFELDEDSDIICLDNYAVVSVHDDGKVSLDLSDEIGGEDFDEIENEWKAIVLNYADFTEGAVHVSGDYDNDDGEKTDIGYWLGSNQLVLQAELKDLETKRDDIEHEIARKRRELANAKVEETKEA